MAGTSSEYMPHRGDDLAGLLSLLRIWAQTLERRSVKIRRSQPASRGNGSDPDATGGSPGASDRKVFQRPPIPAMACARDGSATRTGSRVPTVNFHDATVVDLATRGEAFTMLESEQRFA